MLYTFSQNSTSKGFSALLSAIQMPVRIISPYRSDENGAPSSADELAVCPAAGKKTAGPIGRKTDERPTSNVE
jgi:hypothetical protein